MPKQEHLATLISDGRRAVAAYLDEQYAHLVATGASATFQPDGQPGTSIRLKVVSIESDTTRQLTHPMLTTPFGRNVPARLTETELIPEHAVYRITLEADAVPTELAAPIRRGTVTINAGSESVLTRFGRTTLSVVWRELGF